MLCGKLMNIQYIDVAEQCISIFQRLAEYGPTQARFSGSTVARPFVEVVF